MLLIGENIKSQNAIKWVNMFFSSNINFFPSEGEGEGKGEDVRLE
jgi:hypothetical protein